MKNLRKFLAFLMLVILVSPVVYADGGFRGNFTALHDDQYYELALLRNASGKFEGRLVIDGQILLLNAIKLGEKIGGQVSNFGEFHNFIASRLGHDIFMEFEDGRQIRFKPRQ
jgi:hypothetical protein